MIAVKIEPPSATPLVQKETDCTINRYAIRSKPDM